MASRLQSGWPFLCHERTMTKMIIRYHEKSIECDLHSGPHRIVEYPETATEKADSEEICECSFKSVVQAEYDWAYDHKVRLNTNVFDTYRSQSIYLTPNQARQLASMLCFAANDAETLNKEFPIGDDDK